MRMCVIAQTPLISPFGSIGFREREARGRKDGGRGGEAAGDARRRRGEENIFLKV